MPYRPAGSVGVFDDSRQATHCWKDDGAEAPLLAGAVAGLAAAGVAVVAGAADVAGAAELVPELPSGTFTSSPTVMRLGSAIWGFADSTRASDTPDCAAMPLSVSPAWTACVLASAGPAASPAIAAPAPSEVIIRVRTFIALLVWIA